MSMTEEDKTELAKSLGEQLRAIQSQMDALGLTPPPVKTDVRKAAPDGGPQSDAHVWLPKVLTKTVLVVKLDDAKKPIAGSERRMNAEDFDPDVYRMVEDANKRARTGSNTPTRPPEKPRPQISDVHEDEIRIMTLEALKKLPEFASIPEPLKNSSDKTLVVDAIIAVRDAAGVAV